MRNAHRVETVRAAERALMARLPPGTLMQRAAAGLASVCAGLAGRGYGARVVVFAGSGDNGGDALYAGARLAARGARVVAVAAGSRVHPGGSAALRAAGGTLTGPADPALPDLAGAADLIIDGLLGIGGRGGLREAHAALAQLADRARADRAEAGRAGVDPAGGGRAWAGRTGVDPAGVDRAWAGRTGVDPAGVDRAWVDRAWAGRAGAGRAGVDPAGGGRAWAGRAGGGRAGAGRAWAGRSGGGGGGRGPTVVAVDLPSGVDADTGEVAGAAVRADVTVTFGTWKPGLFIDPGAAHAGVTELIDIGLGPYLPPPDAIAPGAADVAALLPVPGRDSDKYRRGVLGVIAGSDRFTGAAALAVGGAIRGGAGMVRLVSAAPAAAVVRQHWPEAVITVTGPDAGGDLAGGYEVAPGDEVAAAGRVQAWLAGPGMGTGAAARRRLAAVLATGLPVLVDADGLTLIAAEPGLLAGRTAPTLLTPHAGELARLLGCDPGEVAASRARHARAAAEKFGCCVLLKGSTTVIAPPPGAAPPWAGAAHGAGEPQPVPGAGEAQPGADGPAPGESGPLLVNTTGTGWLATAGTGDVLSGLAGALLAQGLPVSEAAAAAAFLHGIAARQAAYGTGPDSGTGDTGAAAPIGAADVIEALPAAIRAVRAAAG
jgi:ADP-dependent NAD(P)H-hydrate dehydratase / NAD(P)H-hydrate epimerase